MRKEIGDQISRNLITTRISKETTIIEIEKETTIKEVTIVSVNTKRASIGIVIMIEESTETKNTINPTHETMISRTIENLTKVVTTEKKKAIIENMITRATIIERENPRSHIVESSTKTTSLTSSEIAKINLTEMTEHIKTINTIKMNVGVTKMTDTTRTTEIIKIIVISKNIAIETSKSTRDTIETNQETIIKATKSQVSRINIEINRKLSLIKKSSPRQFTMTLVIKQTGEVFQYCQFSS